MSTLIVNFLILAFVLTVELDGIYLVLGLALVFSLERILLVLSFWESPIFRPGRMPGTIHSFIAIGEVGLSQTSKEGKYVQCFRSLVFTQMLRDVDVDVGRLVVLKSNPKF